VSENRAAPELSELSRAIISLADSVTALRQHVGASHGVSDNELRAAVRIATEQSVTPSLLADRLRLSSAAVTVIVEHLVERGIAIRKPNPADRRSTLLTLTPRGEVLVHDELDVLDRAREIAAAGVESLAATLEDIALTVAPERIAVRR
jgi:DNA-binding MarR family transcriptional regulator